MKIEKELGIQLPIAYKELVLANPFVPYNSTEYLIDDPGEIITKNLDVRVNGYWGQDWPENCFVIGEVNADLYFIRLDWPNEVCIAYHDEVCNGEPILCEGPLSEEGCLPGGGNYTLDSYFEDLRYSHGWMTEEEEQKAEQERQRKQRDGSEGARMWLRIVQAWTLPASQALQVYHEVLAGCQNYQAPGDTSLGVQLASLQCYLHYFRDAASYLVPELKSEGGPLGQVLAERGLLHYAHLLVDLGPWLAEQHRGAVIQRLAMVGRSAEDEGNLGLALTFYTQAQALGANAAPALERLGAAGAVLDNAMQAILEKLLSIPKWPSLQQLPALKTEMILSMPLLDTRKGP
ncbi:MAG: hypothetical protein KF760_27185 [Candidatus Eremiobacteraeota bacterium]|nr:hypothetical protein [Candidatus Eremiobacteraeota bacterium]